MSSISITTVSPDRWQEYKQLRLEALKNDPIAFATTYNEDNVLPNSEWQDRLHNPYMLFAEHEGILVGMAGALLYKGQCVEHKATIVSVYIKPEYRGQGIATKLMQHLMNCLKSDPKIVHVQLTVNTQNHSAIKLYETVGFKKIGVLEKLVKVNDAFIDGYMMVHMFDK